MRSLTALKASLAQWAALLLLGLVGVAVYANSFSAPLVFDGHLFISENPAVRHIWPWIFLLGGERAVGANRPFGFLTFALNYAAGGVNPWGYHAVNLAIHVAAAWLLFDLVRRTLSRGRLAERFAPRAWALGLAVALVWLVHPLETNAVTYVYQRLESLMALCYLATLWCFVIALDSPRRTAWLAASVVCCALGMATKEVMVTAPLVVLWYDRAFVAGSWRELFNRRGKFYAALAGTWGVLAGLMFATRADYASLGVIVGLSPVEFIQSQPGVILHYLRLSFWPDPLCLDYAWPVARTAGAIVPQALAVGALVALTLWSAWRWPAIGFLGGCFFLILAPTSSIAPLKDLAFEHRMYLPLAALVTLVVVGLYAALGRAWGVESGKQPARGAFWLDCCAVGILAAVVGLGYLTVLRNRDYQSEFAIWQDTARKRPDDERAHVNLGNFLAKEGKTAEAFAEYQRALAIDPDDGLIYHNRGNLYRDLGDRPRAFAEFNKAIELNERKPRGKNEDTALALFHFSRGNTYRDLGQNDEALADYSLALKLNPDFAEAYDQRGHLRQRLGDQYGAAKDFGELIRLKPDLGTAYLIRGVAYWAMSDPEKALADFALAIETNPNLAAAYYNRGSAQQQLGNLSAAMSDYDHAIALKPDYAEAFHNRGAAHQIGNEFDLALKDLNRAVALMPDYAQAYHDRAIVYYLLKQYDKAWSDVAKFRQLGGTANPAFIQALAKDSGRSE